MFCSHTIRCFIVVDGAEGGTGAAPEEFSDHMGMALRDGLILTRNALVGTGLRSTIRIGASGKVYSAFSIARNLALGADWCNAARAFMFTLGCVMSKKCLIALAPTRSPRWTGLLSSCRTGPCWTTRTRLPTPSGGPPHRPTVFSRCSIPARASKTEA